MIDRSLLLRDLRLTFRDIRIPVISIITVQGRELINHGPTVGFKYIEA